MDVNENTVPDVTFGNPVTATDPDSGATLTYSLSGADAASFAIVESSGQLKTKATLDYEAKSSYSVEVRVDGRVRGQEHRGDESTVGHAGGHAGYENPPGAGGQFLPLPARTPPTQRTRIARRRAAGLRGGRLHPPRRGPRASAWLRGHLQEPGLAHLQVRVSYRARSVPLEPLRRVHPYLPSDGSHRRSGACSQSDISDARQPTARSPRRSGGGKVPSATFL